MTEQATAFTDLGDFDTAAASDAGTEIEILHPVTKKPSGIFIGVLGKHSQVFRDIVRERTNSRIKLDADNAKRGKESEPVTAEQVEARAVELLVACTTHWRSETRKTTMQSVGGKLVEHVEVTANEPIILFKGDKLDFNVANATKIYGAMIPVREQVDEAIGNLELFMKA